MFLFLRAAVEEEKQYSGFQRQVPIFLVSEWEED